MVKKLSEKQFTDMSDMTLSLYISIIICWTTWKMQCSSLDLSVKLETFNKDVSRSFNLCNTKKPFDFSN